MTAPEIAAALGGRRSGGGWWLCGCPAHDDRNPSLSLRAGNRGLIVRCWAGCDTRDVLAALRQGGLLGETAAGRGHRMPAIPIRAGARDDDGAAHRIALARRIWDAATAARGCPVARYLAGRGITMPVPPVLRYGARTALPGREWSPASMGRTAL
jgi:putative DNA primase/helicase